MMSPAFALFIGRFLAHHDVQVPEAILLARAGIDKLHTGLEHARDHLDEAHAADVGIGERLEHEAGRLAALVDERIFAVGETETPRVHAARK